MWTHPRDRSSDYTSLDHWVRLTRMLERGLFDGLFLADVLAKSPTVIDGIRPRKSGSQLTRRWREVDSNHRSPREIVADRSGSRRDHRAKYGCLSARLRV